MWLIAIFDVMLISLLIPFCIWHVLMVLRNETTIDGARHPQYNLGWWINMTQARAGANSLVGACCGDCKHLSVVATRPPTRLCRGPVAQSPCARVDAFFISGFLCARAQVFGKNPWTWWLPCYFDGPAGDGLRWPTTSKGIELL